MQISIVLFYVFYSRRVREALEQFGVINVPKFMFQSLANIISVCNKVAAYSR